MTLVGRGRLPSDVTGELMDILADEPRVVLCDLAGMAAAGPAIAEMFAPAIPYLADWPGTVVVVSAPDPVVRQSLAGAAAATDRLFVNASRDIGVTEAVGLLPPLQRRDLQLSPRPTAPGEARSFVTRTLAEWRLQPLGPSAMLVVSELVTNSIVHAVTVLDLRLSRAEDRVRIAVRDRGGGRPSARGGEQTEQTLNGRGLQLVQGLTSSWGVIPAQSRGKTVWAVLDADAERTAHQRAADTSRPPVPSAP